MNWYSVQEVCEKTGLSDSSVRRYLQRHKRFLKTRYQGRVVQIAEESLPVMEKIRQFYIELGWNRERVEEALAETYSMAIVVGEDQRGPVTVGQTLEDVQQMRHILWKLAEENRMLRNRFDDVVEKLEEKEKEDATHWAYLEQEFREVRESLTRVEKYGRKSWLERLFGRYRD